MTGTPPSPGAVPPVLSSLLPPPPPPAPAAPPPLRPAASPVRRLLVGLAVSVAAGALGTFALLGMPGLLPLFVADAFLGVVTGKDLLNGMHESSWGAALYVTLLWPVPFAPALAFFTWLRPRLPAVLAWLLAFAVSTLWAVGVAVFTLLKA